MLIKHRGLEFSYTYSELSWENLAGKEEMIRNSVSQSEVLKVITDFSNDLRNSLQLEANQLKKLIGYISNELIPSDTMSYIVADVTGRYEELQDIITDMDRNS